MTKSRMMTMMMRMSGMKDADGDSDVGGHEYYDDYEGKNDDNRAGETTRSLLCKC